MPPTVTDTEREAVKRRVLDATPYWAENFAKIVTKQGDLIPLEMKPGQLALDAALEEQRAAGKPMRAMVNKARQIGFSTSTQAKLMHRCTLRERYNALTVAHDRETGARLYRMAEVIYANLPEDPEMKPRLGQFSRRRTMHFAGEAHWTSGRSFPDSYYVVDTAGEFQGGRGGTNRALHGSEVAFWPQIAEKLVALLQTVPDDPESLIVLESTPNGFNEWKDMWDDAEEGRSDFIPFFWPWWKEEDYSLVFLSETERERFQVGDSSNPYAEEEPDLIAKFGLSLGQLNWRRQAIANKCAGDLRKFHQEYPATPEQGFISTGGKVFDPYRTAQIMVRVDLTDPRTPTAENPGPKIGDLRVGQSRQDPSRSGGTVEVPVSALWTPRQRGIVNPTAPWRLWLPEDGKGGLKREGEYVVFCDPSGGKMETTDEPDYHAIEVIDHKTFEQVAEYRSRIDPDLLTREVLLIALFFNMAYIGVERTGGWGLPILRTLWLDFHYPHVYRAKKVGNANERTESRLGWDTNMRTKPLLIAGMAELLRIGEDGIKSRVLANEVRTYTRTDKGTTEAEPGRYDDCLMAYMGAQQLARELPLKGAMGETGFRQQGFRAPSLGGYDPRHR
jgi:hypothetical protein